MVSKSYIRLKLAHDDLLQDYLSVGEQTFLKSKEADITRLKQVDMMQLISASASGDRKQVQLLLGMGADVNTRNTVSYMFHIIKYHKNSEKLSVSLNVIQSLSVKWACE